MIEQIMTPFYVLCILTFPSSIFSGGHTTDHQVVHPPPPSLPSTDSNFTNFYTYQQFLTGDEQTFDVKLGDRVRFQVQRSWRKTTPNSVSVYIQAHDGTNLTITAKSRDTDCWFSKTYKSSDGVEFHLRNRVSGADRWTIKKGGPIPEDYTWHREKDTHHGPLIAKDGRTQLAYFQDVWNNTHGTYNGWPYYLETISASIHSNGFVSPIYLLALYETAFVRSQVCGY